MVVRFQIRKKKVNLQELVLSCIKSSDAERRRIFYRMVHTTPRNNEKTRNRRKNTVSANAKNGAPRAPHKHHHTPYQTPLAVKEQTRRYCLRYTRRFDRLALRPIEASAPQNWGILSTTSCLKVPQSWAESVSIARSYDRGDFQGGYTTLKNRIFVSACSRFYRRIFRFFLHFRVEYALISP